MKPSTLRYALMISVLINLGVVVTISIDALRPLRMNTAASPSLPSYLGLDASQRGADGQRAGVQAIRIGGVLAQRANRGLGGAVVVENS